MIELKNLKVSKFASQETTCFEAAVYMDGKKIGVAHNQGCGGPTDVDYVDRESMDKFLAYVETLPPYPAEDGFPEMKMDAELFIGELLEKEEARKWYARKCKKETLFRLRTDSSKPGCDEWRIVKRPFDAVVKAYLVDKYKDQLGEIANETRII